MTIDPVDLARALIRCRSITPEDGGAIATLQKTLETMGFECHRLSFAGDGKPEVQNLYARLGKSGRNFCFAGHSDVVPAGDVGAWSVNPFDGEVRGDALYGRGAADMKSAIAGFVAAAAGFLKGQGAFNESISLLITGDEEGPGVNGTRKVLRWLAGRGEKLDDCLIGEPTSPRRLGEEIKIGRRGSLSGVLAVTGVQGHTAYPNLADNPLPRLVRMVAALLDEPLDRGTEHFQPSNLQLTSIDVGNPAANVIPARGTATFNVRFNDLHTSATLEKRLRQTLDSVGGPYNLDIEVMGEAFLTKPGRLAQLLSEAIRDVTGVTPTLSTSGGTSDARFIKDYCPVAEFGLVGQTMHKVDECVALADIIALTRIYEIVLTRYFAAPN
jgi:succinyl-diaminopimelate desuccinylase